MRTKIRHHRARRGREEAIVLASTGWHFLDPMAYLLLNEKSLYFRRADFEPQRASPFRKGLKAPELLSEATRA